MNFTINQAIAIQHARLYRDSHVEHDDAGVQQLDASMVCNHWDRLVAAHCIYETSRGPSEKSEDAQRLRNRMKALKFSATSYYRKWLSAQSDDQL